MLHIVSVLNALAGIEEPYIMHMLNAIMLYALQKIEEQ